MIESQAETRNTHSVQINKPFNYGCSEKAPQKHYIWLVTIIRAMVRPGSGLLLYRVDCLESPNINLSPVSLDPPFIKAQFNFQSQDNGTMIRHG